MNKILLVEDDLAIQDTFRMIFKGPDFSLNVLSNGDPLLHNNFDLPNLIILDKQLSGMDGVDLCRFLKSNPTTRDIPVMMISASPSVIPLGKIAGANEVLMKPYRLADLRAMVGKLLRLTKPIC